jgi:hypothetical protein
MGGVFYVVQSDESVVSPIIELVRYLLLKRSRSG